MNIGLLIIALLAVIGLLAVGLILANKRLAAAAERESYQSERILDQNWRLCQLVAPGGGCEKLQRHEEKMAEIAKPAPVPEAEAPTPYVEPEQTIDDLIRLQAPDSSVRAMEK